MIWLALSLIVSSFLLAMILSRRVKCTDKACTRKKIDKVSPLIGASAILIGTTLMVGYVIVTYLGKLGDVLTTALRTWLS